MTFLIGGLLGVASWPFRPALSRASAQNWRVWTLGVAGIVRIPLRLFLGDPRGTAGRSQSVGLSLAVVPRGLLGLLPGERLRWYHIVGVVLGLCGALLVISGGDVQSLVREWRWGHLLGFACAIIWAGYSVLSRRFAGVPTDIVAGFCLVTAALAAVCHLLFETTVWPNGTIQWFAVIGLGLMPVGAAFYSWDYGVKHGDIMVLGALSYLSPLVSTFILVSVGFAPAHWSVAVACLLITAGAVIAAKDMLFRQR